MKTTPFYALLIFVSVTLLMSYACNDSTTVGSGLLDDEDIELGFTNELEIRAKTVKEGIIPTYFSRGFLNESYMIGELDDPIFGKSKSTIHFELVPSAFPDFGGGIMDSMVFIFSYNQVGFYGDTLQPHDITITQLSERIDQSDTLYSDQDFPILVGPRGGRVGLLEGFTPRRTDSISIVSYTTDEVEQLPGQLRIRMIDNLARQIFIDTLNNITSEGMNELVNGLSISSVPSSGNSMIGLNLNRATNLSALEVYYTDRIGVKRTYRYFLDEVRHQMFSVDPSGSVVEGFLDQEILAGDPLFIQGLNGVITEIDISSVAQLQDKLINQVELRLFLDDNYPGDNRLLFLTAPSIVATKASNGTAVEDLLIAFTGFAGDSGVSQLFGGSLQDSLRGNELGYSMNLTAYAKEVQKGREDGIIHLELLNRISTPRRTILFGPGHSSLAPELRVTYTIE